MFDGESRRPVQLESGLDKDADIREEGIRGGVERTTHNFSSTRAHAKTAYPRKACRHNSILFPSLPNTFSACRQQMTAYLSPESPKICSLAWMYYKNVQSQNIAWTCIQSVASSSFAFCLVFKKCIIHRAMADLL